ncbi:MAG: CPBP family intramembrane glutamic endopeptidase [Cyanobacteria bacterium P01_F01_bin.33]
MSILLALFGLTGTIWLPLVAIWLYRKGWRWPQPLQLSFQDKLKGLASLYLVLPLVMGLFARWGRVSLEQSGLRFQLQDGLWLALGLGLGLLGLAIAFGLEILWGWTRWQSPKGLLQAISLALVVGLWVGFVEEWLFRGFALVALKSYGWWGAVALSSALFAILHLIWEPSDRLGRALPQLPGLWLMGVVLAYARVVADGSLALSWGIHAGWVCGLTATDSARAIVYTGCASKWLTGLDDRPLAGVMGWLLLMATAATLWGIRVQIS